MKTLAIVLLLSTFALAQKPAPQPPAPTDPSGMYSFLKEGEFVEVDIDGHNVSGFISRYGETDSDKGAFLDYMFKSGSFDGTSLAFTTRQVHDMSYSFKGKLTHDDAKPAGAEGYYVIKGVLTETTQRGDEKPTARQRDVEFKSFPADAQAPKP
ncbi:MAG: hypothetical protein ACRD3E_00845 [Terriglobales bacterium]